MKTATNLLLIIAIAFQTALFAQENGFLFTMDKFEGTNAIETGDHCYIVSADHAWGSDFLDKPCVLLKLSAEGTLLKTNQLGDSYSQVVFFHKEADQDVYYAIGIRWNTLAEQMCPFVASFDSDLNINSLIDVAGIPVSYPDFIEDVAAAINNNGKVLMVLAQFFPFSHHYIISLS